MEDIRDEDGGSCTTRTTAYIGVLLCLGCDFFFCVASSPVEGKGKPLLSSENRLLGGDTASTSSLERFTGKRRVMRTFLLSAGRCDVETPGAVTIGEVTWDEYDCDSLLERVLERPIELRPSPRMLLSVRRVSTGTT
jgi:hypothetical protein